MMPANASKLRVPLFMAVGTHDEMTLAYDTRTFRRAPRLEGSRFVKVDADHMSVVQAGINPLLDWLSSLMQSP